ncbi:hypothetical protein CLSAB_18860 [Clostridium saccharobutylicum]|uniref:hypothetical protein n=1 Tax=Clostridium saccharobutylicum TaxID=169679 RepID=UPI00098C406F|nr:hypothetical protein [Clostridium saccharobutylicum]OOM17166.1 hypothetical protein CLSAB_18860 [Clostridium saccharobutylicum]
MEKLKRLVALAKENNENAEILIRNDREHGWFVHFLINPLNIEDRKSLFKKYGDLDTILNQLEMVVLNTQY